MNKKYKIAIVFLLIYPILFFPINKYSNIQLKEYNANENLETFDINVLVKFQHVRKLKIDLENIFLEFINEYNKYSDIKFNIKSQYLPEGVKYFVYNEQDQKIFDANKFSISRDLFSVILPTNILFDGMQDIVTHFRFSQNIDCKRIIEAKSNIRQINPSYFIVKSSLIQKINNTNDDISLNFKQCFEKILIKNYQKFLDETFAIYNFFTKEDNYYNFINFINNFDIFDTNEVKNNLFNKYKLKIDNIIFDLNQKIFWELEVSTPYNYSVKDKYIKRFSILNVSLILTFISNLIFLLFIYFLSLKIHFLKKFF